MLQADLAAAGKRRRFPASEVAAVATLALPIYPELSESKQAAIVAAMAGYLQPGYGTIQNHRGARVRVSRLWR